MLGGLCVGLMQCGVFKVWVWCGVRHNNAMVMLFCKSNNVMVQQRTTWFLIVCRVTGLTAKTVNLGTYKAETT